MCKNNFQKGSAIYFAVVTTALILGIGVGLSILLFGALNVLQGSGKSILAFHAAETGAERVLFEDRVCQGDPACLQSAVSGWGGTSFSNGASYSVIIETPGSGCAGSNYCAESTGVFQGVSRRIEIER